MTVPKSLPIGSVSAAASREAFELRRRRVSSVGAQRVVRVHAQRAAHERLPHFVWHPDLMQELKGHTIALSATEPAVQVNKGRDPHVLRAVHPHLTALIEPQDAAELLQL